MRHQWKLAGIVTLWLLIVYATMLVGQERTFRTDASDSAVTQMRTYWRERMTYIAKREASCVSGHWRDADSTFVLDSLTKPMKNCEFPTYQGMLAYLEVDAWDTYESTTSRWKLIMYDHPGMLFLGAVVGMTPNHRPILWGIQRHAPRVEDVTPPVGPATKPS